ncbi:MAG TPA: hypothetical protein VIA61_01455 [Methylomirabilota bacterium]|jgi:hypothetical protein
MIGLVAALCAVGAYAVLALTASSVAAAGLAGLLLAAVSILARWRWLAVVAACVDLVVYAVALSIERAAPSPVPALVLGLALVVLLDAVDLSARVRAATVGDGVVRSALVRWIGLGLGAVATATATLAMAGPLAAILPVAASPLLAAAGALASVLIVAALIRRAA